MIPYNTDAPIYHVPIATVSLIVVCTVIFFITPASLIEPEDVTITGIEGDLPQIEVIYPANTLLLQHGAGIKPWQWLTSIFVHQDFFHLFGNMIFLWAFGLVVEGKVGSPVFLLLYMAAGVGQSAVEQVFLCLAGPGASLGASAAIFGLLGIALVWAPRNDFDVFYWFGFYVGTIEIPIMVFAFIKFVFEILGMVTDPSGIASSIFHMMGLGIGVGLGFLWLKRDWVDCEGWDLVSVWKGDEGRQEAKDEFETEASELVRQSTRGRSLNSDTTADKPTTLANTGAPARPKSGGRKKKTQDTNSRSKSKPTAKGTKRRPKQSKPAEIIEQTTASSVSINAGNSTEDIEQLIASDKFQLADKLLRQRRSAGHVALLDQEPLFALINGLMHGKELGRALPLMSEHAKRFEVGRLLMLLNQAKILLKMERPRKALQVLRSGANLPMDESIKKSFKQLATAAKRQIDEGVIELGE